MTPERTIKVTLLDGSIVTMNTEERVITHQLAEQMIPLTTDADSVFDDVLAALEEAQQRIGKLELYVKALEFSRDSAQKMADNISKEKGLELYEAQQTIARQRKSMELSQSFLQKHGGKFEPGAAEFILNGALEGETQP